MASLEAAPSALGQALELQAEVTNLPRLGYEGNYAFPTMQANFAATQPANESACELSSFSVPSAV